MVTSDASAIPSGIHIIHQATNSLAWAAVCIESNEANRVHICRMHCPRPVGLKREVKQNCSDGQLKEDDFMPGYAFSDVLRLRMVAEENISEDNIIETSSDTRRL